MIKQIWINLPVKDVAKSKEFFTQIGFVLNPGPGNSDDSASFLIGEKNVVLMLFQEAMFKTFTCHEISDTKQGTEILFSIDAESTQEVDELAVKVEQAGGTLYGKSKSNQGWMYGCGFVDLDGHRWNVLHMEMSKMPK